MRGVWLCVWAAACAAPESKPAASGTSTTTTDWTIGLPTDTGELDDPRRITDTGLSTTGTGADTEALFIRHGGFAFSSAAYVSGYLQLTTGDFTCKELFDRAQPQAEGIHIKVEPEHTAGLSWEADYAVGNSEPPAIREGWLRVTGSRVALPEDAWLTIVSADSREVVVNYSVGDHEGTSLRLTNCGDELSWTLAGSG